MATPFTSQHLHAQKWLEEQWIVYDPEKLPDVVGKMMTERKS
jgi:hypothetical protein